MGNNRKENLKKSLGLSEYPWSSDDEDNPQTAPESISSTSRRQADTTNPNVVGTSAQADSVQSPNRRIQARVERELYWSLLNLPRPAAPSTPSAAGPPSGPSRPPSSVVEPTESIDLTGPMSLRRIFAIKKLRSNQNPSLNRHYFNPGQTSSSSPSAPRQGSSVPRMSWRDLARNEQRRVLQSTFYERFKGSHSTPREGGFYLHPPQRPTLRSPARSPTRSPPRTPPRSPPSDSAPSDDELLPSPILPRANPTDNTTDDREQNDREANIGAVGLLPQPGSESLRAPDDNVEVVVVEEAIEIDRAEEHQPEDNASNQAQASGDDEGNERTAEDAATAASRSPQGTKRKRGESVDLQPLTVQDLNRSLLQLLECPVCLEWMEPPMSQCRRGHLVCVRCRARLSACPVCRTTFSSVRNRAMEGVAEMLRYPCRHGCGRETQLRRRNAHEASCASRRYRCPAAQCARREPLPLSALPHHFQTSHQAIMKVGNRHEFSMKMNVDQHDDWLVVAGRDLFHLRVDVNVRTWGVVVHVAYIGPKCNANTFTYEVSVVGLHNERKLVYTRETHSDLESASLNVSRQDCFHLTLDQAVNFLRYKNRHCEPDKFLEFTVEISKREPSEPEVRPDPDS